MFGKGHKIKVSLAKACLTQGWLIGELEKWGISTNKTEMSSVLAGTRKGPKADTILQLSEKIIKAHEENERAKHRQRNSPKSAGLPEG